MVFAKTLTGWYLKNRRELPWRESSDPYRIWLSEIMLQQTRIAQGLPYYLKFINAFPTVFDLARASEENVLKLWQGLGYYSRARNLHFTAKHVAFELNGKFPNTYKELLKLKGVGDYTASAIASICYNENVAVVDGNVYRVLARFFDIDTPINSSQGIKEFKGLAEELLDKEDPGTYNQAIMEFGALQCTPQLPKCESCPLSHACLALKNNKVHQLPVKLKKAKVVKRYFNYLVYRSNENTTIIEQRVGKGIWEGLYQFPLIETPRLLTTGELIAHAEFKSLIDIKRTPVSLYNETPVVHKLSHQHIYTRFWIIEKVGKHPNHIPVAKIQDYPVPVLIANFLKEFDFGD
ncbi:A/G-specific adenine glycosylase [Antarcticibacterium arcticum]|uniref:Adenine DNA glycosylase n=1 Tax=Antarcticibacterium arcticum TaxID=2585771 RepID=A0A5B8YN64_9FLAO|nr:A/G-specific adenine glycosylase [Antarcticibacterium arcticum]QED38277.1 A/G-specific adenine glycosylase [Antarcticibacterium arcticum]